MIAWPDRLRFSAQAINRQRFRTGMLTLSLTLGVAAIHLLTGLSDGARVFVLGEFRFLSPATLIILPGKKETRGGMPPLSGEAPNELTLEDAEALARVPGVWRTAPFMAGLVRARVSHRNREVMALGTSPSFLALRQLSLVQHALQATDTMLSPGSCLIGQSLRRELLGSRPVLGQWLRLDDRRCRVTGVLAPTGVTLGLNLDDVLILPIQDAQSLFNQSGLFRIFVEARSINRLAEVRTRIRARLAARHNQIEDFTIVTQDALLGALDDVLQALTAAAALIAAISMLVSGVLIMNMALISLAQRREEMALLKALGATRRDVLALLLAEHLLLGILGILLGSVTGDGLLWALQGALPDLTFSTPLWARALAASLALSTCLFFVWLPARRAVSASPAQALHARAGATG